MSEKEFSGMQNGPGNKHAKHLKITKRDKHLAVKILVAFAVIVSGLSGASLYLNKRSQKREVAYLDRFNLASDRDVQASDGNALNQFASEVAAASSEDTAKGHTVVVNGKILDDDSTVDSLASSADSSIKYDGLYVMNYADAQQAESAVSNLNTDNSKPASVVDGAVWSIQDDAKQNYDKPTEIPDSLAQSASPREDAAKQKKTLVALIDTGDNNADSSVDFTGTGSQDRNGHGTYMAGLIKERSGDQAYILSLKAMNDDGTGSMKNVTAAVKYAINAGADIINMSISAPDSDAAEAFKTVVQQAVDNGIRVVAAAGNYSADISKYVPANIPGVISVGAVTEDGMIADFSNYGKSLTMSVKGADSTSEAAAVVSGYLAGSKELSEQKDVAPNYTENPKNDGEDKPANNNDKFKTQRLDQYLFIKASAGGTYSTDDWLHYDGPTTDGWYKYHYVSNGRSPHGDADYLATWVWAIPNAGYKVSSITVSGDNDGSRYKGYDPDPITNGTHTGYSTGNQGFYAIAGSPTGYAAGDGDGKMYVEISFEVDPSQEHRLNVNINDPNGNEKTDGSVGTFSITRSQNWDGTATSVSDYDNWHVFPGSYWRIGRVMLKKGYEISSTGNVQGGTLIEDGDFTLNGKVVSVTSDTTVNINTRYSTNTFHFDANGGSNAPADVSVSYSQTTNNSVGIASAPGAKFVGWYTAKDGGERVYGENGHAVASSFWNSDGTAKYKEDGHTYTLYARYVIHGDTNGVNYQRSVDERTYTHDAIYNWIDGQSIGNRDSGQWMSPHPYSTTTDLTNDGYDASKYVSFTLGVNGQKVADKVIDFYDMEFPETSIQISNVAVPVGYKFLGYDVYKESESSQKTGNTPEEKGLTPILRQRIDDSGNGKDFSSQFTLDGRVIYVATQGVAYNLTFDANPRTYNNQAWPDGNPLNLPTGTIFDNGNITTFYYGENQAFPTTKFTWAGHTFLGWSKNPAATMPDTVEVYTAHNTKKKLTLGPNGPVDSDGNVYANACWDYFNADLGAYAHQDGASITLYAVWRTDNTTVTIDPNGGSYSGKTSVTQPWGSTTNIPNPTPAGENITVSYNFNDTADEKDTKAVKKDANGNNLLDKNGNPVYETVKAKHNPGSWDQTQPDGVSSTAISQNKDSSHIVFNRWDIIGKDGNIHGNSVTFGQGDKAYGYFSDGTHYVLAENPVILQAQYWHTEIVLPRPVRDGYTFIGWYSDDKCTKKVGNAGDAYRIPNGSSIRTFYARWIKNTYTYQDTIDLRMEDTTNTREGWLYIGKFDNQGNPITTVDTAPENAAYNQAIIQISEGERFDSSKVVLTLKTGSGLYDASGKLVETMHTEKNKFGHYELTEHITFGKTYTVHESQAPAGHYYSQDIKFTATKNSSRVIKVTDSPINFDIVKQDSKVNTPLSNATFQLIDHSQNGKVVCTDTTDENGMLNNIGKNLIAGHNMTLHETNAPTGYKVKDYPIQVPQYKDSTWETQHLTAERYILPETSNYVKLNIKKVDKSGTGLSGAQFQLYVMKNGQLYEARHDNDNNLLDPMSSDYAKYAGNTYLSTVSGDDGLAKFEQKLPPKALSDGTAPQEYTLDWGEKGTEQDWYIKEVKAPEGRSLLSHPVKVSLKDEDNKTYTVVIQDDQVIEVLNSGGSGSYKILYLGLAIAVVGALGAYLEKRRTA